MGLRQAEVCPSHTVLAALLPPKPQARIFAQSNHCLELSGAPARIQSSFKPSANDTAAPASFIFCAVNRAIRSPMLLLETVWRLSKFAAQVFGRPSSSVNTTSVGMLRIVEVIGAMVTEFSTPIAESRVTISTGRLLSGALKVYQQISPRFTMRPNPAH